VVSALAHWALLATPPVDTRRPRAAPAAIGAPMTVRFAPQPDSFPQAPAVTDAEGSRMPEPAGGTSGHAPSHMPATAVAPPGADAPAVLRAPDPTYYPARELDAYPQPARPLALDRPAGAGSIRLLLLIDEHGVVNDVSLVEADAAGHLEETLRAALAATRFLPAQKDGRAVRSRIVLSVSFATAREQ
jgi:outer membrane biosynthesis protein TonB